MVRGTAMSLWWMLGATALAAPPDTLQWQGRLLDALGGPVEGLHDVDFRILDDNSVSLWSESHTDVPFDNGFASVALGSSVVFPSSTFSDGGLSLEITLDSVTLSPTTPIHASPFARTAVDVRGGTVEASSVTASSVTATTVAGTNVSASGSLTDATGLVAPPGMISAYGGTSAPSGWLLCDGATVSRTTYARLFAALGTTYGAGNGSTTFRLPDLRGVFARGAGSNSVIAGNTATLGSYQDDQLDDHTHYGGRPAVMYASSSQLTVNDNSFDHVLGTDCWNCGVANPVTQVPTVTPSTANVGGETRPANVGVNYIIKY